METRDDADRAALRRVLAEAPADLLTLLSDDVRGADLTTLLLEVMRRRASRVTPAELMHRYSTDRFVGPATVAFEALRRAEDALLGALPESFERLELAPLVPLGTHSAITPVDQNRIVSTIRGSEVAADPTDGLALEAASRRRRLLGTDPRSAERMRLAAVQRVVRAQRFEGAASFAHFKLLGLVTAGRDTGNLGFECESASEHVRFAIDGIVRAGADAVRVELTDFVAGRAALLATVAEGLSAGPRVEVVERPEREAARGYYAGFCFKAFAVFAEETFEVADGGHVDWTQQLVPSRKERLMISGLGLDRLAVAMAAV